MKKINYFSIIVLLLSVQHSFSQQPVITESEWKSLSKKEYVIQYPPDWEPTENGEMGTTFVIFSPSETKDDQFRENVNLIIQDLKGKEIDLDRYTSMSEKQIKTIMTNAEISASQRMKGSNGEYHKLVYISDQGGYHLKYVQYYWIINEKAYLLTFTSEQNKFDAFRETGMQMMNSFQIR